jgi:hypothetical protein
MSFNIPFFLYSKVVVMRFWMKMFVNFYKNKKNEKNISAINFNYNI